MTIDTDAMLHPFTGFGAPPAITGFHRGEGCWLFDRDGRAWLDAFAGLWCVSLGYGRADLIAASDAQMRNLAFHPTFWGMASEPAAALAARLRAIAPGSLDHVFFASSGSEANDTAIKLLHLVNRAEGRAEKRNMLSFDGCYHGVTYAAAGLTGLPHCHAGLDLPFDFQHKLPNPLKDGLADGAALIARTEQVIAETIARLGAETIAALFVEPVMGTGGVLIPPPGWLKAVERVCRAHGILLVVDEVMTGFCRTGRMFACEHDGVEPDMLVLAKGLTSGYAPMSALMISADLRDRLARAVPEGGVWAHGFTCSGHPVAAAVALACIDAYEREALAAHAATLGDLLLNGLRGLAGRHTIISDVRGRGLLAAVQLGKLKEERTGAIRMLAYEHGLLVRAFPGNIIALAPPLPITRDEIGVIIDRLDATLTALADGAAQVTE